MKRVAAQHATRVVDVPLDSQHRMLLEVLKGQPVAGRYRMDCEIDGNQLTWFNLKGLDEDGNLMGSLTSERLDDETEDKFHTYRVEFYDVTIESGAILGADVSAHEVRVYVHDHRTDEVDD